MVEATSEAIVRGGVEETLVRLLEPQRKGREGKVAAAPAR